MSDPRTALQRVRLLMTLALLGLLALGSFWLLDVMQRGVNESPQLAQRTAPDYYVDQFTFVRLNETGRIRYRMAGTKMTHLPQDDSHEIQQPVVINLSDTQPPMTVRADRAHTDRDNSHVQLYNRVQMDRPASPTSERWHMKSDYLLVLPDEEVMQTHLPVEIISGTTTLNGVGMFVNNATREFRLANRVRGQFLPAPHS